MDKNMGDTTNPTQTVTGSDVTSATTTSELTSAGEVDLSSTNEAVTVEVDSVNKVETLEQHIALAAANLSASAANAGVATIEITQPTFALPSHLTANAAATLLANSKILEVQSALTGSEQEVQTVKVTVIGVDPNSQSILVAAAPQNFLTGDGTTLSIQAPTSDAIAIAVSESMIDSGEFRQMQDVAYVANGRLSPSSYNLSGVSYATLTPLQQLPPISTVSDKFSGQTTTSSGNVTLLQQPSYSVQDIKPFNGVDIKPFNTNSSIAVDIKPTIYTTNGGFANIQTVNLQGAFPNQSIAANTVNAYMSNQNYNQQNVNTYSYNQNDIDIKTEVKPPKSNSASTSTAYKDITNNEIYTMVSSSQTVDSHQSNQSQSQESHEEINTKELAQRISAELKRYSIPQAVFAQRVLCRSQGTLSDLLRNPKPWSKLKSGRETFRRMWKWLQEPEFQRMSQLRLAGKLTFSFLVIEYILSITFNYLVIFQ